MENAGGGGNTLCKGNTHTQSRLTFLLLPDSVDARSPGRQPREGCLDAPDPAGKEVQAARSCRVSKTTALPECKLPGLSSLRREVWATAVRGGWREEWIPSSSFRAASFLCSAPVAASHLGEHPDPSTRTADEMFAHSCASSVAQSCLTLWDPMDCSPAPPRPTPQAPLSMGFSQVRI